MQKEIEVALLISTYNSPEALELVLLSVLAQSQQPNEVLIADDGSSEDTKSIIECFQNKFSMPLKHVWHEDEGFRLAKIRNKALAIATADYIIQIDGDMILHRNFIEDHKMFALTGTFVRASRVYIDEDTSKKVLDNRQFAINAFTKGITNFFSAIRVPFMWPVFADSYKNTGDERYEIHGCNMAFWRNDAIRVNGYDERFNGWGPEDKEFIARLINIGIKKRFIKLGAIAFHIYHAESSKSYLLENEKAFKETIRMKKIKCEFGINQYL